MGKINRVVQLRKLKGESVYEHSALVEILTPYITDAAERAALAHRCVFAAKRARRKFFGQQLWRIKDE